MQAIRVHELNGIESLRLEQAQCPAPAEGEIRLAVYAAGCNFADTLQIQGTYQTKPPLPFIPGLEVAGEAIEVGAKVSNCKAGDRVMGWVPWGGYATEVIMSAWAAIPIPAAMGWEEAASFPICYGTAYGALSQKRVRLEAGETLLVHGAAGGVGLAAVDVGKAMGATVVASAGSEEKLQTCREYGADHVINYRQGSIRDAVKAAVGGVDVVLDPVGGDVFTQSLRCTNRDGRLIVIGFTAGTIQKIPANYLLLKNISVAGYGFSIYSRADPAHYARVFAELCEMYDAGKLTPKIHQVFSLADTGAALRSLVDRQAIGKVVVRTRDY
jgi:NADPH2:quinone reductase